MATHTDPLAAMRARIENLEKENQELRDDARHAYMEIAAFHGDECGCRWCRR